MNKCWCGSGLDYEVCHREFDKKINYYKKRGVMTPPRSMIKNQQQIEGIKKAAVVNNGLLDYIEKNIKIGMSTEDIDVLTREYLKEHNAHSADLNYEGYPKSICTSINDVVCHGIPSSDVILKDGDIINVDVSTIYKGYYSDSSRMFCIGEVSPEKKRLVEVTKQSIDEGLKHVKPWGHLGDMGQAIHDYATANGYTVVREIGGHGIGLEFHEDPFVSYVTPKGTEMLMVPGMVFTIEPMVNAGTAEIYQDADNGWTIYTDDGKPSAQWEVTVAVTEDGCEVLVW